MLLGGYWSNSDVSCVFVLVGVQCDFGYRKKYILCYLSPCWDFLRRVEATFVQETTEHGTTTRWSE
jgi:hypothetical protein